jgi:type II secretory pathway component GspD/PulD (secretin)
MPRSSMIFSGGANIRVFKALIGVSFLATLVVLLMSFRAQSNSSQKESSQDSKARVVSIKVRDAEVSDVLHSFADQIGARLVLDQRIQGKISIEAKDSELSEVMDNLCTALKCQWRLSHEDGWVLSVQHLI